MFTIKGSHTKWLKKQLLMSLALSLGLTSFTQKLGIFEGRADVGPVLHPGSVQYDTVQQQYVLSGSGANIWFRHDEMCYLWKKMKGNFILQSRGALIGRGVDPHRKFGWMVRSSLDSGSAMVSSTVHGDGLTSLQYRRTAAADVEESKSDVKAPDVIQLERRSNAFIMSVARHGEPFATREVAGINLGDDVYVGLFICSHNKDVTEKVSFRNVRIIVPAKENFVPYRDYIGSNLEVMDVANGNRQVIFTSPESLQAPNWTPDGKSLIYNSNGLIYRFDLKKRLPEVLNTDFVKHNNNDHVLSFDGKMLGLSSSSGDPQSGSLIYTVPVQGGRPKLITPAGPSYLHGWSPDGKFLIYTGQRNNEFDIYRIPSNGGPEVRLTDAPGLDDGSEYTPDGKFIYFNSMRSGNMQIWRMKADGSGQEQLTSDEYNNWFPHVSPDGRSVVFLSFMKDVNPADHPFYKQVYLRMMPITGGPVKVIAYLYGGQGSINTPSWSPDSKRIAFISNTDVTGK